MQLGINKIEADEVIAEVRYLDQERLNEEVLHGFSTDIIRKYWMPKPFIKPHSDAEALNEETAEILEKKMISMMKPQLKPFFMMILKLRNKKKLNNKKPDKSLSGFSIRLSLSQSSNCGFAYSAQNQVARFSLKFRPHLIPIHLMPQNPF